MYNFIIANRSKRLKDRKNTRALSPKKSLKKSLGPQSYKNDSTFGSIDTDYGHYPVLDDIIFK